MTLQEIIDNAAALADALESTDVRADDVGSDAEVCLARAVIARADSERSVAVAVAAARNSGSSWARIGSYLGTSGQAARERYSKLTQSNSRTAGSR